jgi:hypothetical protein
MGPEHQQYLLGALLGPCVIIGNVSQELQWAHP